MLHSNTETHRRPGTRMSLRPPLAVTGILFAACLVQAGPKFDLKGNAEAGGGYESNIFRRPSVMDTGTGEYSPVEGAALVYGAARLRGTLTVNKANRLQLSAGGDYSPYPGLMAASQGQLLGDLEYRFRPVKSLSLTLQGDGGYVRKLALDETADETADLYEYWQYGGGPRIEFAPSKTFSLEGSYAFTYRDYVPPDSGHSLDNQQHEAALAVSPRFGKENRSSLTFEGAYLLKKYRELLSYDAGGNLDSAGPIRTYHYLSLSLGYRHDFGAVVWEFADRPRYRIDAFDNYFTYLENRLSTRLAIDAFSENTFLALEGAWRFRIYTVHPAMRPGTNPNLIMNYFDAGVRLKQRIWKILFLAAEYDLVARTTNTGYLSYHTYRGYLDHTVKGGVRVEW